MIKIPPPIQTAIAGILMYFVSVYLPFELYVLTKEGLVIVGLFLVASAWLIFPSVWSFWKSKTTVNPINPENATKLVISGNYRFSRNPMYLGMAGVLIAWSIYLSNPITVLIILLYVKVLTEIQIKPEEKALERLFGAEYKNYCESVRRWI